MSDPAAEPGARDKPQREDLVGGEGPAIPRSQYEAALKGSGCIEIYDPAIDDFRLYDVTTPEGIGAIVSELTARMFKAAVAANLAGLAGAPGRAAPEPTEDDCATCGSRTPGMHFTGCAAGTPGRAAPEPTIDELRCRYEDARTLYHEAEDRLRAGDAPPNEPKCKMCEDHGPGGCIYCRAPQGGQP